MSLPRASRASELLNDLKPFRLLGGLRHDRNARKHRQISFGVNRQLPRRETSATCGEYLRPGSNRNLHGKSEQK